MVSHESLTAIERYDGVFFRVVRKHAHEAKLKPHDIVIVSPVLGLLVGDQKVQLHNPEPGSWRNLKLDPSEVVKQRHRNFEFLRQKLSESNYSEIYVNVGKVLLELIAGFETMTRARVIYATGTGPGPKAQHMLSWLLGPTVMARNKM